VYTEICILYKYFVGNAYKLDLFWWVMEKIGDYWKKSVAFLKKDSWPSFAVTLILAFVIIKFIFFPGLSLITGTSLPLVIVESCSMYHSEGLEEVLDNNVYDKWGIDLASAVNWDFKRGMSKGDVIFVVGTKNIEVGDVIIFTSRGSSQPYPIIHRVVTAGDTYSTKGDHNTAQLTASNNRHKTDETNISEDEIIGKALFKVPFVGWAKLIFFEGKQPSDNKGLCQ